MSECNPNGDCYMNLLCERCHMCVGHCTCPPVELRATEQSLQQHRAAVADRERERIAAAKARAKAEGLKFAARH